MADYIETMVAYAQQYWWAIAIVVGFFVVMFILKNLPKGAIKPVKRAEIERVNFLKRMDFNDSKFKTLIVDGKKKFKILKFQASNYKEDGKETPIYEMVLRRLALGLIPYGAANGYVFNATAAEYDYATPNIIILKPGSSAFMRNGIYIDNSFSKGAITFFNREYSAINDMEGVLAQVYATSQEQSVIDPDRGHMTLSDHLEIEKIKEQKRKLQLGA